MDFIKATEHWRKLYLLLHYPTRKEAELWVLRIALCFTTSAFSSYESTASFAIMTKSFFLFRRLPPPSCKLFQFISIALMIFDLHRIVPVSWSLSTFAISPMRSTMGNLLIVEANRWSAEWRSKGHTFTFFDDLWIILFYEERCHIRWKQFECISIVECIVPSQMDIYISISNWIFTWNFAGIMTWTTT